MPVGMISNRCAKNYAAEVSADAPICWLRMHDTSGAVAQDSSGNDRDGVYVNTPTLDEPGPMRGQPSAAVLYSAGSSEECTIADTGYTSGDFSWEGFVRWDTGGLNDGVLIRDNSGAAGSGTMWLWEPDGTNALRVRLAGTTETIHNNAEDLRDGTWHHAAVTFDVGASSTEVKLYIDGTLISTTTVGTASTGVTHPLHLCRNGTQGEYVTARLSEFAVYDKVLSAERVRAHWRAGCPPFTA